MKIRLSRTTIPWLVVVFLSLLWFISPVEIERHVQAPSDDSARYQFGDTRSVGQEFNTLWGLHTIRIPLVNEKDVQGPILLHIRETYFGDDVRTAVLYSPYPTNRVDFSFFPIYSRKSLVWVLEAPKDPDKTFNVFREIDSSAYSEGDSYVKGKGLAGNFGFTQVASQPQGLHILERIHNYVAQYRNVVIPTYMKILVVGTFMAVVLLVAPANVFELRLQRTYAWIILVAVIGMTVASHVWYADILPFNNDEGAYLQDAFQTDFFTVPIRDYLTKGPVYIYALKLWIFVVPSSSIVTLRLFSAFWWCVGVVCLYFLATHLFRVRSAGLLAAGLFGLSPVAIATSTPLLLQVMSVPVTLVGLVVTVIGISTQKNKYIMIAAFIMIAAYFTRASSVVSVVVGLAIILLSGKEQRWRQAGFYIGTGLVVACCIAVIAYSQWGFDKVLVLFNLEALRILQNRSGVGAASEPVIREILQWTRLLWQSTPWFLLGLMFLPLFVLQKIHSLQMRVLGIVLWAVTLLFFARHWIDMDYLLVSPKHLAYAYVAGLFVFVLPFVFSIRTLLIDRKSYPIPQRMVLFLLLLWLALYVCLYQFWGDFVDNYLVEFIGPLGLLFVYVFRAMLLRFPFAEFRRFYATFMFFLTFIALTGFTVITEYQHTGTMDSAALRQITSAVRRYVPKSVEVFTAQSAITALSERPIFSNYSHSGWYLYEARGDVPTSLRDVYFADPDIVTSYLRDDAEFIVIDRRTNEVYFNDYPERQEILSSQFELVTLIPNRVESFGLYQRR